MAMDLNAKAAYIRGLMNGLDFDPASKNGKIIAAMMDLLEELAAAVMTSWMIWTRIWMTWSTGFWIWMTRRTKRTGKPSMR